MVPEKMKIKVVQIRPPPSARWAKHRHGDARASPSRPTYLLERGQYERPDKSQPLQPAVPEVIGGWKKEWPVNRIGLAKWLTDPAHPLTARVTVNRIWQRLFGLGLVKTSENFGVQGEHPSHPKLLDWLATEFIRGGWDLKATYKMLVTSATYRQSSNRSLRIPKPAFVQRTASSSSHAIRIQPWFQPVCWSRDRWSIGPTLCRLVYGGRFQQYLQAGQGDKLYRRSLYATPTIPPPPCLPSMRPNAKYASFARIRPSPQSPYPDEQRHLVESARHLAERILKQSDLANEQERITMPSRQSLAARYRVGARSPARRLSASRGNLFPNPQAVGNCPR